MMKRNILLVAGLLALLAGTVLSVFWLQQQRAPGDTQERRPVPVAVLAAAHTITTGTLLRPDDMVWSEIARGDVRPGYILRSAANEADFTGALARREFQANEPFLADGLVKKTERSFLAAVLAPGHRAITIAVDASQTASGLVMPGDRVDIVLTQNLGDQAKDSPTREVSEVVLRDVRIVAVDQSLGGSSGVTSSEKTFGQTQRTPQTVTLELSERDAQKLLVAAQLGKIDLSVRALEVAAGSGPSAMSPVWADEVSSAIRALKPSPAPPPLPPSPPATAAPGPAMAPPVVAKSLPIEVMHGAKIELR